MMKFKKIIFVGGLLTSIATTGFALSCGNSEKQYKFQGFSKLISDYEYQNVIYDAKILNWKDGDTAGFEYKDKTTGKWIKTDGSKRLSLRLASIDTPELHVVGGDTPTGDLGPKELFWAQKGKDWAEKQIPVGTIVKIWTTGSDSYGRWVGSIFYGDNFKENFSVNIIKEGLTIPRLDNKSVLISGFVYPEQLLHYLAIPIWYAYHEAKSAKKNLFGLSQKELKVVYTEHGIPGNEIDSIEEHKSEWMAENSFTKYDIYKEK